MQSTPSMPLERSRQALHAPPRCAAEWGAEAVEIPKPKRPAVHLGVSTGDRLGHLGSCSQRGPRAAGEKPKAFGTGHCGSSSQSCPPRTILQVGWVAKLRTPPRRKTQPRLVPAKPRNSACITCGAQQETTRCVFVCCRLQLARGPEEAATCLGLPSSRTTTRPQSPRPQEHSGWVRLCNCDGGPRGNTQWWRPETPAVRGARPPSPLRCEHRAPVDSQDLPGARRRRSRARLLPTPRAAARHRGRPSAGQRSRGRPAHQPPGSRGCRAARPVPNRRPLPSAPPFTAASSVCSACAAKRPRKLTTAKASHAARS